MSAQNLLDPNEGVVELWVDWLEVFEGQRLVQDALVKWQWETRVDELAVEKRLKMIEVEFDWNFSVVFTGPTGWCETMTNHGNEAADELEIFKVVGIYVGGGVDLKTVVFFSSIFKKTVHGV